MSKRIVLALLGACALPVLAGNVLEFRLAQSTPTNGWSKVQFNSESLWLKPTPELTSTNVAEATLEWSEPPSPAMVEMFKNRGSGGSLVTNRQPRISIRLDDNGSAILAKTTQDNYRKNLVILSKGDILTAPVIMDTITGGVAVISGAFTETEAQKLVDTLNKKSRTTKSTVPSEGAPSDVQ